LLPVAQYTTETHQLSSGARFLAYTDGLTEVFHGDDEFGPERLRDVFLSSSGPTGESVLDTIWNTIEGFGTGEEQRDDMTALVLLHD
jgi:phosphoserine phosphatase RsbU/P